MPVLDRRGRNVGGVQKSRRMKAVKREGHVLPKDFGIGQTSALRYTRQWHDPVGRVIATGDYGFVEGDAISVSEYIPRTPHVTINYLAVLQRTDVLTFWTRLVAKKGVAV